MLRTLVRDTAVYAVGVVLSRLVGFVMIPVYTRVLTPADYGVVETISRLTDIVGLLVGLGMSEALLRFYNEAKTEQQRGSLISTSLVLTGLATALATLVLLPVAPAVTRLTFGNAAYAHLVALALLSMMLGNLGLLPLTLLRAQGRAWEYTALSVVQLVTALSLNILLVVHLRWGVAGVVWSGLLNGGAWSLALVCWLVARHGGRFNARWALALAAYGVPLVPAAIAQFVLHFSDRFFLVRLVPMAEVGVYALAYRVAMLVSVFTGIANTAWWPWVFARHAAGDEVQTIRRGSAAMLALGSVVCSGVMLSAHPCIRLLAGPSFWRSADYVPWLALAYWFFVSTFVLSVPMRLHNRTRLLAGANVTTAAVCLALNAVAIPRFGAWGAAGVTTFSMGLLALLEVGYGRRLGEHTYGLRLPVVLSLGLTGVAGLTAIWGGRLAGGIWRPTLAWAMFSAGVIALSHAESRRNARLAVAAQGGDGQIAVSNTAVVAPVPPAGDQLR
ncbi:MAG: oligosaccharide flippase family protein [Acidithiobacillus sp.]|uniref:lipopolysaccharide biosynthesis protein n=1 Tax=Acidithiobacillus sp. TaxID=1872118 RepID=UPI00258E8498|nr:oligosaccharide flippase family protein [Acidithiobacillus sp.]MCE5421171.1 oligosaccharide flippase family protein [Acidithiobacillus sp.]